MYLSDRITSSIGLFILLLTSLPTRAASPQQIKWQDLSIMTGKNVSLVLPDGAMISGRVLGIDTDALRLNVGRSTDPAAHPKGEARVPRASLRTLEVQSKGRKFRIIGTAMGAVVGFAGGLGASIEIRGGIFGNKNRGSAALAWTGITAGGALAGYLMGNRADRRSKTYEILP